MCATKIIILPDIQGSRLISVTGLPGGTFVIPIWPLAGRAADNCRSQKQLLLEFRPRIRI